MKEILDLYRKHPRILELRLAMIHSVFVSEYGVERTAYLFKSICDAARINWTTISSIINRKDAVVLLGSKDKKRFRQEVIFMGMCYGESRLQVGKRYLGLSKRMMYEYNEKALDPSIFVNTMWLDGLDYSVVIAGVDAYRLDLDRFLEALTTLGKVIGNVPVAKA